MRLLFDHQFFPILKYSGITRYLYEIIRRMAVEEHDVDISLFMGIHINRYDFKSVAPSLHHFFSVQRPDWLKLGKLIPAFNKRALSFFTQRWKPDIYHQTYYTFLIPEFSGARVVTIHDLAYFVYPQHFDPDDPMREEIRKSAENADAVIAISEYTKRELLRILHMDESKIHVIYQANSFSVKSDSKPMFSKPYILYVGQRFAQKNFKQLLHAFGRSKKLRKDFTLLCFGGTDFTAEELTLIEKYRLNDIVHLTRGDDTTLATCYAHARALCYPSLYEGFGMPILEAMHYGCPVVASNHTSLPEVGGTAACYFDPTSVDDLVTRLEQCVYSDEDRSAMREAGYVQEQKFSWDKCARETAEVYRSLS